MAYGAIDLHKKESQIRIVMDDGEVLDRRIATTRERFTPLFCGRPPMRIVGGSRDRERVGGAAPRGARTQSHRAGSEILRPCIDTGAAASRPIGEMRLPWRRPVSGRVIARRIGARRDSAPCRSRLNVRRE